MCEITLTCNTNSFGVWKKCLIFLRKGTAADQYIWLTKQQHMSVFGIQRTCCHIYENLILPWEHRLIDANASEFSALQLHEMKIIPLREQINSELCHAIFVSYYIWSLFIPVEVLAVGVAKQLRVIFSTGSLLPKVKKKTWKVRSHLSVMTCG